MDSIPRVVICNMHKTVNVTMDTPHQQVRKTHFSLFVFLIVLFKMIDKPTLSMMILFISVKTLFIYPHI